MRPLDLLSYIDRSSGFLIFIMKRYATTPRLETERLILRRIHSDDTEKIFACWMNDERVS